MTGDVRRLYEDRGHRHPLHSEMDHAQVQQLARQDGVRMVAMLAEFLSPGDDPAKVLHELMAGAGFPVPAWLDDDERQSSSRQVGVK